MHIGISVSKRNEILQTIPVGNRDEILAINENEGVLFIDNVMQFI